MSLVSIRVPAEILDEVDKRAKQLHISRAEYIREAVAAMNAKAANEESYDNLQNISLKVRGESMRVNAEFSEIEYEPKDE